MNQQRVTVKRFFGNSVLLLIAGASFSCMAGGGSSRLYGEKQNTDPRIVEIEAIVLSGHGDMSETIQALNGFAGLVRATDVDDVHKAIAKIERTGVSWMRVMAAGAADSEEGDVPQAAHFGGPLVLADGGGVVMVLENRTSEQQQGWVIMCLFADAEKVQ